MSELRARSCRASSFSQQELIARPGEPQRAAGLGYPYSHCSVYVNPPAGVEMLADSNCRVNRLPQQWPRTTTRRRMRAEPRG